MLYFNLFIFLTLYLLCSLCKENKYCAISEKHILCKYSGLGKDCKNPRNGGVTTREKNYIVYTHNNIRRKIAEGQERRGLGKGKGQPPSGGMMKIKWDLELQTIAQRLADQCTYSNVKPEERKVERWNVGQNIYLAKPDERNRTWPKVISEWLNEVNYFEGKTVRKYRFNSNTSKYTQLVWGRTYRIGCGTRSWSSNKLFVCNYGPAGNVRNAAVYKTGKPCTKCPKYTYCESGLCVYPQSFLRADVIGTESPEARKSKP